MDEADYLGDRIGIMSCGKQVTCGSSMFLKNKFGVGYILNILKEDETKGNAIISKIKEYIPEAQTSSNYGLEMKIQIPKGEVEGFQPLFEFLETNGKDIGVKEFGISLTTLEDVFLKVGSMFDEEAMEDRALGQLENAQNQGNLDESQDLLNKIAIESSKRINTENKKLNSKLESIDPNLMTEVESKNLKEIRMTSVGAIWFKQFGALIKKRLLYLSRDIGGIVCEIFIPLLLVIIGLALTKIQLIKVSPKIDMDIDYIKATNFRINKSSSGSVSSQAILDNIPTSLIKHEIVDVATNEAFQKYVFDNPLDGDLFDIFVDDPSDFKAKVTAAYPIPTKTVPSFSGTEFVHYNVYFNTTYPNSHLVASTLINDAIFKAVTGNSDAYIKTSLEPMKPTIGGLTIDNTADSINISIMFSLAFAFISMSILLFFIKERISGAKYQQMVSGMYLSAYWTANFVVDYVKVNYLQL